jgi:peptidoglycan/xylan/chitin deacetylase (PgdA/CDA1 family)
MDIEQLRVRREQRRRAIRRRRRVAVGVLTTVIVVAVAVVLLRSGSAGSPRDHQLSASVRTARARTGHSSTTSAGPSEDSGAPAHASTRAAGPPGTDPVPILMYHVIAAPPPAAPFPGLYVEPAEFTEQMQALESAGWHAVTLDQVESYWRHGTPLGRGKPIVISFDNGYNSQYTQALPVLQKLGWVADENLQLSGLPPSQGGLGQEQIRGLLAAGWELDTQGISHADLITLDAEQLHYQVATARQLLQQRYHVPVNWFCYPSGHYNPAVVAAVKAAGFTGSTTVVPGWTHPSDDPYRMHRLRVLGGTSGAQLLELLASTRENPPAPTSYSA